MPDRSPARPGADEALAAMRATREYMAGMAFGVPEDARDHFSAALTAAVYPIIAAAVLAEAETRIESFVTGQTSEYEAGVRFAEEVVAELRSELTNG